jgi:hypothetical protein
LGRKDRLPAAISFGLHILLTAARTMDIAASTSVLPARANQRLLLDNNGEPEDGGESRGEATKKGVESVGANRPP